ncbi:MAG: hypothetical protein CMM01_06770 [Rhodopirellula sp.]|nr:hypothetical protein [Rhodopirellula sp.]
MQAELQRYPRKSPVSIVFCSWLLGIFSAGQGGVGSPLHIQEIVAVLFLICYFVFNRSLSS